MATPITASAFVAALKKHDAEVEEVDGWREHNRNHKGPWGPVHGILIHHTATSGSATTVELIHGGRPDLPGPLSHCCITKDGTVHLVGHGRANHAGTGDGEVLRAVTAEKRTPEPGSQDTDGNRHFYGFECENLGDGEDAWPDEQLEATAKAAAALCSHHGWNEKSVIGHLEWTGEKSDPRGFAMDDLRERVKARLK